MMLRWNMKQIAQWIGLLMVLVSAVRAEYHGFNTARNSDGVVQEVRWPYWAETTYNAIYSQTVIGSDGGSCYFYGGMPSSPHGRPPCSIIWSFWPPSGTAEPGAAVKAEWTAPNMFAPPHIGEGASGKVSGEWPIITTNRWYREVLRIWQPVDGTEHLGYAARWLQDSDTGIWYHLATMRIPFACTGINPLSGFQEDFYHRNRNPRRTDYRNVYYHKDSEWTMANQFTCSVRQAKEKGQAYLIENDTAVYFEVSMAEDYEGNLDNDAGKKSTTLTLTNQPKVVRTDPIVVTQSSAVVAGDQLLVEWDVPNTSSPQFAYRIEVYDNPDYIGTAVTNLIDIAPETRRVLVRIPHLETPRVRLTIIDVFEKGSDPILITPAEAILKADTSASDAVAGLDYKYYELNRNFTMLPDFSLLQPVYQGALNFPDLTIRRQRAQYAFNYSGYIKVPADGVYVFTLDSSDGSRLLIDGISVVDWDGQHSPSPMTGWVALKAGLHPVELHYFFDTQKLGGELIDSLQVRWAGPGVPEEPVPVLAWHRVPIPGKPEVTLTAPLAGAALSGNAVVLSGDVIDHGATIEKVSFYVDGIFWGAVDTAPYTLTAFLGEAVNYPVHARVHYDDGATLDSSQNVISTVNMDLAPWSAAVASEHTYPQGARMGNGTQTLIGDGLNMVTREITGDCTLVARVADILPMEAAPDGQYPDRNWEAGIIMRETTTATPGTPLGNNRSAKFAAVFATVNNKTHYQDGTMANAGGPFWSKGLGKQRWLKLERRGKEFYTSVSADGSTWTEVNRVTLEKVKPTLHVGVFTFAAFSQNPSVHWAEFDNISVVEADGAK